jgi:hypothetical protein
VRIPATAAGTSCAPDPPAAGRDQCRGAGGLVLAAWRNSSDH